MIKQAFWNGFEKEAALGQALMSTGQRMARAFKGQAGQGVMNQVGGAAKSLKRSAPQLGTEAKNFAMNNPGKTLAGGAALGFGVAKATN